MLTEITLQYIASTRTMMAEVIEGLSLEELNQIPEGFNNNIIWNLGHMIISTLGLCYIRSQVRPDLVLPFPGRFGRGTRPEVLATDQEVDELKALMTSSLERLTTDIKAGDVFDRVVTSSTDTYQVPMDSIENILICCLAHENLHLGIAKAQKAVIVRARLMDQEQTASMY